jgi:hypothetical protein
VSSTAKPGLTRGSGFLETFLAKKRASMANRLIEDSRRKGKIIELVCGTTPYFLIKTDFAE